MLNSEFALLERQAGVVFEEPAFKGWINPQYANDFALAMDAQPALVTVGNAGIPAYLSMFMDPKVIEVLLAPNRAAEIVGSEVRKGDWVTRTAMFSMVESTGETSAYGDWNNNGSVNANMQFPQRQSFHYQTITQWGQKQLAEAGLAKIDWASRLNIASAIILNKFQNNSYFYGIANLENYGLLNDPSLPASIQPGTKVAGGKTWAVATPNEVFSDIQSLFVQLASQSQGLVDRNSKIVLAMSPASQMYMVNTNLYNVSVFDLLKKAFPNIRFETAVQYAPVGGTTLVQMIVEEVDGQETAYCAFTEKMRAHPVIQELSAFKQKKSQGTWGTIIFRPFLIASMVGV